MPVRVALDKEKRMNKFLQITLALSLGLGGASLGYVQGVRQSQHRFETSMRDEVGDIYDELAAMIFVSRINMNLATQTNHYITHPPGQEGIPPRFTCQQCVDLWGYIISEMPVMDTANEQHFDEFYRQPFQYLLNNPESIPE